MPAGLGLVLRPLPKKASPSSNLRTQARYELPTGMQTLLKPKEFRSMSSFPRDSDPELNYVKTKFSEMLDKMVPLAYIACLNIRACFVEFFCYTVSGQCR